MELGDIVGYAYYEEYYRIGGFVKYATNEPLFEFGTLSITDADTIVHLMNSIDKLPEQKNMLIKYKNCQYMIGKGVLTEYTTEQKPWDDRDMRHMTVTNDNFILDAGKWDVEFISKTRTKKYKHTGECIETINDDVMNNFIRMHNQLRPNY